MFVENKQSEWSQRSYQLLTRQAAAMLSDESDFIANCANLSALLFLELPRINWVGVYLLRDEELVVGPFQGKPACTRIELGKGVCGTAAATRTTQLVDNVHEFEGHIACDGASNSEIVIPLIYQEKLIGVLDIDSPELARFSHDDQHALEEIAQLLLTHSSL